MFFEHFTQPSIGTVVSRLVVHFHFRVNYPFKRGEEGRGGERRGEERRGFVFNDLSALCSGAPALCGPAQQLFSPAPPAASASCPELQQPLPEWRESQALKYTNISDVQTYQQPTVHTNEELRHIAKAIIQNNKEYKYQPAHIQYLLYLTSEVGLNH